MENNYKFTIALIYDFDGTLAAGNMQEYNFIPAIGKSNKEFWSEANDLAEEQDADQILTYMALMIREAQAKGISLRREAFQECGRDVKLYPGVSEWFDRVNSYGAERGVKIVHYINSSGLKEIIEGTAIADRFQKKPSARLAQAMQADALHQALAKQRQTRSYKDSYENPPRGSALPRGRAKNAKDWRSNRSAHRA